MKQFKFILRLLIAIVIGIPTAPIVIFTLSFFGLLFIIAPIVGIVQLIYGWLISDKWEIEQGKFSLYCAIGPFFATYIWWSNFVLNKKEVD